MLVPSRLNEYPMGTTKPTTCLEHAQNRLSRLAHVQEGEPGQQCQQQHLEQVSAARNAEDHGQKYHRRDQHLDQRDESIAEGL